MAWGGVGAGRWGWCGVGGGGSGQEGGLSAMLTWLVNLHVNTPETHPCG